MLIVHRAERADRLVDALGSILATPPTDPFTPEIVSVPSRGIERWLTQRLSNVLGTSGAGRADGICANLEFPFPGRLVGRALHAVTGIDPAEDPWAPARAAWPLMSVIDEHLDEDWMATLAQHLGEPGDEARRARRFGTARHVADLFDRYSVHRPAMITSWARGDDVDGVGDPLPPDMLWQADLWRLLRDRIDVPSPAERLGPATERLRRVARPRRAAGSRVAVRAHAPRTEHAADAGRDRAGSRRAPVPAAPLTHALGARRVASRVGRRREPAAAVVGQGRARDAARHLGERRSSRVRPPRQRVHARHAAASAAGRRPRRRPPTRAASGRRRRRASAPVRRRQQRPGALVPRAGASGRGGARGHPPPAGRRSDARAAGRHRDVPGHRDVRSARARHVRHRRRRGRRWRHALGCAEPACPAGGSGGAPDQPRARRAGRAAGTRLGSGHGVGARRLRRARAGQAAVPPRRRRARPDRGVGERDRCAVGPRRRAPGAVPAGCPRRQHVAGGARPCAARCVDDRGRLRARRRRPPVRRRRQRRHRPRRAPRRARRSCHPRHRHVDAAAADVVLGGRDRRGDGCVDGLRSSRRLAARRARSAAAGGRRRVERRGR